MKNGDIIKQKHKHKHGRNEEDEEEKEEKRKTHIGGAENKWKIFKRKTFLDITFDTSS